MKGITNENSISVDVSLCGSIPRAAMTAGAPCRFVFASASDGPNACASSNRKNSTVCTTGPLEEQLSGLSAQCCTMRGVLTEKQQPQQQPLAPLLEPPTWAVPAKGETRLEPVCEALGRQQAVDLTVKASFRIGRSPSCDIQLLHGTSSRRHAMLFHHSNGSCYIVDCGSAHGTFVNGKRISSPAVGGVVVPFKVRRGAMVRFGGPGAPCFVLKSFSFTLGDVVETNEAGETPDKGELVRRNTRFNALGQTAMQSVESKLAGTIDLAMLVARKRSFDSLCSSRTMDEDEPLAKRVRCSSPPLSPDEPLRLVSPDLITILASKPRRVHFSSEPPQFFYPALVTPEDLSSEEDNCSL